VKRLSCADIAGLRGVPAGTLVALEGALVTLRDRSLARLAAARERGEALPVELAGCVIFFAGPTPGLLEGVGSIGPTTSRRMAAYLPLLCSLGVGAVIGKGPLDEASYRLLASESVCYLQAFGGAGAWYGKRITAARTIGYHDLGPEALYELTVSDFVAMMSLDGAGNRYP